MWCGRSFLAGSPGELPGSVVLHTSPPGNFLSFPIAKY